MAPEKKFYYEFLNIFIIFLLVFFLNLTLIFFLTKIVARYIMVANFYLIVFIISVGLTVNILIKNRKIDNILILFSILLNINLAGQYLIAISESVEMAI